MKIAVIIINVLVASIAGGIFIVMVVNAFRGQPNPLAAIILLVLCAYAFCNLYALVKD